MSVIDWDPLGSHPGFMHGEVNRKEKAGSVYTLHRHGGKSWIIKRTGSRFSRSPVYSVPVGTKKWNALLISLM